MSDNLHIVKVEDYNDYKKTLDVLKNTNTQYFTYTPKQEKCKSFLLKGLDSSYEPKEVMDMLNNMQVPNLIIKNVTRFTTPKSVSQNRTLPFYLVQLTPESIDGAIRSIRTLDNQIIYWEPLKKRDIIQCKNCQRLNHTAANCRMAYRCVKCQENHKPGECKLDENRGKNDNNALFCTLCYQYGHPATYRGCPKQIEAMEKRTTSKSKTQKSFEQNKNENQMIQNVQQQITPKTNEPRKSSYADKVKSRDVNDEENNTKPKAVDILQLFQRTELALHQMQERVDYITDLYIVTKDKLDMLHDIYNISQKNKNNG